MLISYKESARQRGVLAKRSVDRARGARPHPGQHVGRRLAVFLMRSRTLGGWRRGRDDHGRREHQRQRGMISARPEQCASKRDRGSDDRDPAEATEAGEKAGGVCEVRGGDEGQRWSDRTVSNASRLKRLERNQSTSRAIIARALHTDRAPPGVMLGCVKPRAATPRADQRLVRERSSQSCP
jgi:hypothetical protein